MLSLENLPISTSSVMLEVLFPIRSLTKNLPHFEMSLSLICEVYLVVVVICIPLVMREVKCVSEIF